MSAQLHEVCEAIVDCEHKTAPTLDSGFPLIRTPNIGRGYFILDEVRYVSDETYRSWTKRVQPRAGDLIMAREAPVGNVACVPKGLQPCLGQRTLLIRPDRRKIDPRYLTYLLLGPVVQGAIHGQTNGATVPHLNMKDLRQLALPPLPSLQDQRRIAGTLSAYDDLIENCERRTRVLDDMARALYREWFVLFRYPGHEKTRLVESPLGLVPERWRTPRLSDILVMNYGKALRAEDRAGGTVPVFGSSGVVGFHDQALASGPGLILGRKCNVGSIFWSDTEFFVIDTAYFVTSGRIPLRFLYFDLQGKNFLNSDAAVPGLSRNQAYALQTVLPPNDLLDRFTMLIEGLLQPGSVLRREAANLRKTRDLLLPRLLSGRLSVEDLE